jgi:hypothetical protein
MSLGGLGTSESREWAPRTLAVLTVIPPRGGLSTDKAHDGRMLTAGGRVMSVQPSGLELAPPHVFLPASCKPEHYLDRIRSPCLVAISTASTTGCQVARTSSLRGSYDDAVAPQTRHSFWL